MSVGTLMKLTLFGVITTSLQSVVESTVCVCVCVRARAHARARVGEGVLQIVRSERTPAITTLAALDG